MLGDKPRVVYVADETDPIGYDDGQPPPSESRRQAALFGGASVSGDQGVVDQTYASEPIGLVKMLVDQKLAGDPWTASENAHIAALTAAIELRSLTGLKSEPSPGTRSPMRSIRNTQDISAGRLDRAAAEIRLEANG